MSAVDIEYCLDCEQLEDLLLSIDRPGDFCAHGRLFAPMPRLEVDGVGLVSFPVPEAQVRALIEAAERAPYGKGPDTLVDTSVRDCWQIDAERIRLGGGAWRDTFAGILDAAARGLGCPKERLDARFYKLLVYEPGGFFSAHRDTEKADGMIATLSISLPAAGAGGELIVRHRDREAAIDMNVEEPSELAFAAFYADCSHEIRPVLEGHRLSLVFNLCLRPGDADTPREAPDYTGQVAAIAGQLVEWSNDENSADKLVWLLDHAYSESGLSFDALKNSDATLARVLAPAAEQADCDLYAAIVHITEYGSAMYKDDYAGRWGEASAEDVELVEVGECRYWLDGWVGRDGSRPPVDEIPLAPGELLPQSALDDADPDEQWLHEASGNEGASLERAYRYAAFVLWPRSKTLAVVASAGIGGAVAWVAREFDRNGGVADERISRLVSGLIDVWWPSLNDREDEARTGMLSMLSAIGDQALAGRFLREVVLESYSGSENEALAPVMALVGPDAARSFLPDFVEAHFSRLPKDTLDFLRRLGEAPGHAMWADALREAARAVFVALPAALAARTEDRSPARGSSRWTDIGDADIGDTVIRDLFALAWRCELMTEAETAAGVIALHPQEVAPDRTLPKALSALSRETGLTDTAAFASLWRHATDFLLARSATPPEEPRDWAMAADVDCDCDRCKKLRAFCKDPVGRVARFPLRQDLRAHLQGVITRHRLDLTYVTERKGRPYTLVCTKTRASHERRLAEYARDVSSMRSLIGSAPGGERAEPCAPDLERLREAVDASQRG